MAYTLGIDVGTTFTAAATWSAGVAAVLPLGERSDSVETVLCRNGSGWLVGEAAVGYAAEHPESVARGFKRRMGDAVPLRVGGVDVLPEQLTATVIRWVVDVARARFGVLPDVVCLTHPAAWGGYRLDRLRRAAEIAGLPPHVIALAPEPIAAACYYSLRDRLPDGALLAVYDFGGGTFDAGLVRKSGTGFEFVGESVGIDVGGLDVDEVLLEYVRSLCGPDWASVDLDDPGLRRALGALRAEIVLAKEALSVDVETSVRVRLPGLTRSVRVTRWDLEALADEYIDRTIATFRGLLERNRVRTADVSGTLLVGGSSRMPAVAERIAGALGLDVSVDAHPKYAICLGAAALAAAGSDGASGPGWGPVGSGAGAPPAGVRSAGVGSGAATTGGSWGSGGAAAGAVSGPDGATALAGAGSGGTNGSVAAAPSAAPGSAGTVRPGQTAASTSGVTSAGTLSPGQTAASTSGVTSPGTPMSPIPSAGSPGAQSAVPSQAGAPRHPPVSVALVADLVRAGLQQSSLKTPGHTRGQAPGGSSGPAGTLPAAPSAPPRRPVPAPSPGSVTEFRTRDEPADGRPLWPMIVIALVLLVTTGVVVLTMVLSG